MDDHQRKIKIVLSHALKLLPHPLLLFLLFLPKLVAFAQMNNATLHTLVLAVKAHQRQERRRAVASGAGRPDGLVACIIHTPKTKKEMSHLIRSHQGQWQTTAGPF